MKSTTNLVRLFVPIAIFFLFSACIKDKNAKIPNFEKTFGGTGADIANSLIVHDNAIYLFGMTRSFGDTLGNHYLVKTDLFGKLMWEKNFGGVAMEQGIDLLATNDGNILLVGTTESIGAGSADVHLLKINSDGQLLWEKTFGGAASDGPADIIQTLNGDICIVGTTYSFSAGGRDIYLLRLDANGGLIYEKYFGAANDEGASAILELNNQDLLIYGYTNSYGAVSRDLYLLKTNAQGISKWSQRYGTPEYEESQAFALTPEGDVVMTGHSMGTDPNHQMYTLKADTISGHLIWTKEFGGMMHDGGEALLVDSKGNYVFIGRTMSYGAGNEDAYLVQTDKDGTVLSERYFGGTQYDRLDELIEYNGAYYLVGQTNSSGKGDLDVYLVRYGE